MFLSRVLVMISVDEKTHELHHDSHLLILILVTTDSSKNHQNRKFFLPHSALVSAWFHANATTVYQVKPSKIWDVQFSSSEKKFYAHWLYMRFLCAHAFNMFSYRNSVVGNRKSPSSPFTTMGLPFETAGKGGNLCGWMEWSPFHRNLEDIQKILSKTCIHKYIYIYIRLYMMY